MRHTLLIPAALLIGACGAAAADGVPEKADPAQIPNYTRVSPQLAASGQPSAEALPKLGALGFKTVINLRMPGEDGPKDEKSVVEAQGLRYVHVPVTGATLSLADVAAVEKVLGDPASGPVLLHCAGSNRVGAVLAAIEARKGKPLDEALAMGRSHGLRSPALEDTVRTLVAPKAQQ